MTDLPSSTSNSDSAPGRAGQVVRSLFFLVLWLAVADIAINLVFPFPEKGGAHAGKLARYFEYGRSIEGKLDRMVDPLDSASDDPVIEAGWLEPSAWSALPEAPNTSKNHDLLVAGYGMSFSNQLLQAMSEVDGGVTLRLVAGPAAPPSHTFRAWEMDAAGKQSDVAVFGVLASSIKRMQNLSGMTWTYEHPTPFTYPKYSLDDEIGLVRSDPTFQTLDDFREALLLKGEKWDSFVSSLRTGDSSYDPLIFRQNVTDRSALLRLARRAHANASDALAEEDLFAPANGFNPEAEPIRVLQQMLQRFAEDCRVDGRRPIVALFNDRGYQDSLDRALVPFLEKNHIAFVSSTMAASSDDPSSLLGDGHFTKKVNHDLGTILSKLIRKEVRRDLTKSSEKTTPPATAGLSSE